MVLINEWLPNPVGQDAAGEFVELWNTGNTAVSLGGYTITTDKKKFSLGGRKIAPGGYLVLKTSETKLSLKNTDGELRLYGPKGIMVDHANFVGSALAGKSFSRVGDTGTSRQFTFADPTPGAKNAAIKNHVTATEYPPNISLVRNLGSADFLAIMFGTATLIACLVVYVIGTHEDLSELLLGGDKKNW